MHTDLTSLAIDLFFWFNPHLSEVISVQFKSLTFKKI